MAASVNTWAQVRQQARAQETQVCGHLIPEEMADVALDGVLIPHSFTIRRETRDRCTAERR